MTHHPLARVGRAAVLLVVAVLGVRPAFAQTLPTLPPPPPQTGTLVAPVAPIVSPTCGSLGFALVLVPLVSPVKPPPQLLELFGPVNEVCGVVPVPANSSTCLADQQLQAVLDTASAKAIGSPSPLGVRPVGEIVDQLNSLVPAASALPVSSALGCVAATPAPPPPAPEADNAPPDTNPLDDIATTNDVLGDTNAADLAAGLDLSGRAFDSSAGTPAASREAGQGALAAVTGPGFAYPVVLALPLLLLMLGGYLGWALTRNIRPPDRA